MSFPVIKYAAAEKAGREPSAAGSLQQLEQLDAVSHSL